jgi:hypothetical protein
MDPGKPALAVACSWLSQVKTPKPIGLPVSAAIWARPLVTAIDTYSKCGVSPFRTTPKAITASKFLMNAFLVAAIYSKEPDTRIETGFNPCALRVVTHSFNMLSVKSLFQIAAIIAILLDFLTLANLISGILSLFIF